jgi:hypothetical protein
MSRRSKVDYKKNEIAVLKEFTILKLGKELLRGP